MVPASSSGIKRRNYPSSEAFSIPPSPRHGGELVRSGRIYRFRKNLDGRQMRRQRADGDKDFECVGYAATDREGRAGEVAQLAAREQFLEPRAPRMAVAAIRRTVIKAAGGPAHPYLRAIAEWLEWAAAAALPILPDS